MGTIIAWIIIGGLAGWIASKIMKRDAEMGIVANILADVIARTLPTGLEFARYSIDYHYLRSLRCAESRRVHSIAAASARSLIARFARRKSAFLRRPNGQSRGAACSFVRARDLRALRRRRRGAEEPAAARALAALVPRVRGAVAALVRL